MMGNRIRAVIGADQRKRPRMKMTSPINDDQPERLDDVRRVADYLGVSIPTLYRLLRSGKLKGHKVGGQWRISREAVEQNLEDQILVPR